jgi:uncharacterized membrane protein YdjX (TVP38/TMEM64 family)
MRETADALACETRGEMTATAEGPHGKKFGALARVLLIVGVLVAATLAIHLTPVRDWLGDVDRLRDRLHGLGTWVYPLSVIAIAILIACGIPRLLFCAVGGAIFGFWIGLLITQIGTVLGHYGMFLFMRWGGREWALGRWPKLRRLAELVENQGVMGVILLRQLPVHSALTNLCLGLSHLKHRQFLIGSAIGILPEAIPATLIGAGLVKASLKDSAGYIAIAAAAFALIWIVCTRAFKKIRNTAAGADLVKGIQD